MDDEVFEVITEFEEQVEEYLDLDEEDFWDMDIELMQEFIEVCQKREAFETARKWRTGRGDRGH